MSLLPLAVARNPAASAGLLRAAAARARTQDARAALRVHPALPDDLAPPTLTGPGGQEDTLAPCVIDTALLLAHTTPTTRHRLLASLDMWALVDALDADVDVHPDLLAHVTARLPGSGMPRHQILSVLHHPSLTPDVELDALRVLLTMAPTDLDRSLSDRDREYALTRATAHPDHLAELAALADPELELREPLRRYALLAAAGHDPYTARVTDIRTRAADPGRTDHLPWHDAIAHTGDPTIAAEALTATTSSGGPTGENLTAIFMVGRLRYTDAHYRARRHQAGERHVSPLTHAPTDADLLFVFAGRPGNTRSILQVLFAGTRVPRAVLDPVVDLIDRGHQEDGTTATLAWQCAIVLALHPELTAAHRVTLTAVLSSGMSTQTAGTRSRLRAPATVVHALASAPDPTAAMLGVPVAALRQTAAHSHRVTAHLSRILCDVLAEHAPDEPTVRAALTLEGGFPGTLGELLSTARTVAH